jgi:hypothetical protein
MTTKVEIQVADLRKPPVMKFPERCVNCGKAPVDKIGMAFATGETLRSKQVMMQVWMPYCAACASLERKMFLFALGPFAFGFLLVGAAVFIPVWLLAPSGTTSQTLGLDVVLAGFAALMAGIIGGAVAEFLSKFLFSLFLGNSFARRPLFVFELLSDLSYSLGVMGRFDRAKKILSMTFELDDLAREFILLNKPSQESQETQ